MSDEELNYMQEDVKATWEAFVIDNDKSAEWALKKIKEEENERDRLIKLAEDEISALENKISYLKHRCDNNTGYLRSLLVSYFNTVPHKETKTQESYKLLSGSLVMKKSTTTINHEDEAGLLAYLKANDGLGFIKTKESVDWANFKKTLNIVDGQVIDTELGTVVEALKVEEVPAEFTIKF